MKIKLIIFATFFLAHNDAKEPKREYKAKYIVSQKTGEIIRWWNIKDCPAFKKQYNERNE